MDLKDSAVSETCELRPVIGLTRGLSSADIEALTINAIRLHRQLVERADQLFQVLPDDIKTGTSTGGTQHLEYIEAMIEMHAQMGALNTLVGLLGRIPKVSFN
ncbi:transcriptional repressor TraM [Agrobacterium pusense]|uniref:transcriptional repressor TraM n=1 Tax=Agrobacterium pusense TaxID=648995 RepID=UPI001C6E7B7F|nr:transcriptional repressor TraM [Agrobacterium pusense]MBW9069975.1 transcriptional repressor TraM [Agrobacterium pusense]MBW9084786.1 transcriptional repressor TraM [Agrobacterium pusense]MBW9125340.1 transcriptional repressor TraM [Agrobacterium pusense]MBW9137755.1 transcriptional repressor TraM [Agrobacterium pusense]